MDFSFNLRLFKMLIREISSLSIFSQESSKVLRFGFVILCCLYCHLQFNLKFVLCCLLKAFKREVVFVVDISKSMSGKPLEDVKNAISTALSKLNPRDSFNIITFSDDTSLFSTSMESVTPDAVERGVEWMNKSFVVADGTNMLPPLEKVFPPLTCL